MGELQGEERREEGTGRWEWEWEGAVGRAEEEIQSHSWRSPLLCS